MMHSCSHIRPPIPTQGQHPPNWNNLPNDVKYMVCDDTSLSTSDLRAIRLISHDWADAATRPLFHTIRVYPFELNPAVLSDQIRSKVRCVKFYAVALPRDEQDWHNACDWHPAQILSHRQVHSPGRSVYTDQDAAWESPETFWSKLPLHHGLVYSQRLRGPHGDIDRFCHDLTTFLKGLTKLNQIEYKTHNKEYGVASEDGLYNVTAQHFDQYAGLMKAVEGAGCRVHTLSIDILERNGDVTHSANPNLSVLPFDPRAMTWIKSIKHLRLHTGELVSADSGDHPHLVQLITTPEDLISMDFSFKRVRVTGELAEAEEAWGGFLLSDLLRARHLWPTLASLKLRSVATTSQELCDFLTNHRASLREVEFRDLYLDIDDTWNTVIQFMSKGLKLERVRFGGLISNMWDEFWFVRDDVRCSDCGNIHEDWLQRRIERYIVDGPIVTETGKEWVPLLWNLEDLPDFADVCENCGVEHRGDCYGPSAKGFPWDQHYDWSWGNSWPLARRYADVDEVQQKMDEAVAGDHMWAYTA